MNLQNLAAEKIFLIISFILGLLFIFFIPPFQGNDEVNHFSRAYQLSQFRIISQKHNEKVGDYLPASIDTLYEISRYETIRKNRNSKQSFSDISNMLNIKTNKESIKFVDFANTSVYPPLAYAGASIGIFISDRLSAPLLLSVYVGRLFNLLLWILMVYFSIRLIPIYKKLFLLLALMPTTLYQATTVSSDPFIMGIGFLMTATFLHYRQDNKIIDRTFITIFLLGVVSFFLIKLIYLPLVLLFFLIPNDNFSSIKQRFFIFTLTVLAGFSVFLVWYVLNKGLVINQKPDVNIGHQLYFILIHPLDYIWIMISTLIWNLFTIIGEFISFLGWNYFPAKPSRLFYVVYSFFLIMYALEDGKKDYFLKRKDKYIIAFSFLCFLILLCTILYITWTPVGRHRILGIYGRYLIPASLLPFLLLYSLPINKKINLLLNYLYQNRILIIFCLFSLCYNLSLILLRYWIN